MKSAFDSTSNATNINEKNKAHDVKLFNIAKTSYSICVLFPEAALAISPYLATVDATDVMEWS